MALGLALLLVYLIMAALFESFIQPLTIMLSVPFAFIGVGIALRLANQPLSSNTNIGLVILLGVVVNNAIVLVDHINQLRGPRACRGTRPSSSAAATACARS